MFDNSLCYKLQSKKNTLNSLGLLNSACSFYFAACVPAMCPWSQKMGDSSAVVVAFHLCQPYCIKARWPPGKISMWGFQLITQKCVLIDNWICVMWIIVGHNNIFEQLKLQYKLLNGIFKLKYGRIWLKFAFILRLSKKFVRCSCT